MNTKKRTVLEEKALKALWALLRRISDDEKVAWHFTGTETLSLAYEAILESEGFDRDMAGTLFMLMPAEFGKALDALRAARKAGSEAYAAKLEQDSFPEEYSPEQRLAFVQGWSLAQIEDDLRDWEAEEVEA